MPSTRKLPLRAIGFVRFREAIYRGAAAAALGTPLSATAHDLRARRVVALPHRISWLFGFGRYSYPRLELWSRVFYCYCTGRSSGEAYTNGDDQRRQRSDRQTAHTPAGWM